VRSEATSLSYFILIGRSHSKLGRFTAHSLLFSSDEMRMVEMDEVV